MGELQNDPITMTEEHLEEYIRERKSDKNSVDAMVTLAIEMYNQNHLPDNDGIKRKELVNELEEQGIDLEFAVGTCLDHLRDIDIVKRWVRGPQILIIHERRDDVVNGEDLEGLVATEIERLLEAIETEPSEETAPIADGGEILTLQDVVSGALDVDEDQIGKELFKGDVPDQMDSLNTAVDAIDESELEKGEYGKIFFIHNPYRYALSAKAVSLMERVEDS